MLSELIARLGNYNKLDSRLKSITTVDTAKIWVKMKPILGLIE